VSRRRDRRRCERLEAWRGSHGGATGRATQSLLVRTRTFAVSASACPGRHRPGRTARDYPVGATAHRPAGTAWALTRAALRFSGIWAASARGPTIPRSAYATQTGQPTCGRGAPREAYPARRGQRAALPESFRHEARNITQRNCCGERTEARR